MTDTAQPTPTIGLHADIPMEEYHSWDVLSNSGISKMRQSPAHFRADRDEPKKDTKTFKIGRAAHTTILEPELFDDTFVIADTCEQETKELKRCSNPGLHLHRLKGWACGVHAKKLTDDFDTDRIPLPQKDMDICTGIRNAVYAHPAARAILNVRTFVEYSGIWMDPEFGIPCKMRIDAVSQFLAGGAIADPKTTMDASREGFPYSMSKYGYHRQAAFYLRGAKVLGLPVEVFANIAVEKKPPYAVGVYVADIGSLSAGEEQVRKQMRIYAECLESGRWPAYSDRVEEIALPSYEFHKIAEEVEGEDEFNG